MTGIPELIRIFLTTEILPGENPDSIRAETNLKESGILDSLSTLKLASFLEEKYHIAFEAPDVEGDDFASIENIERLVKSKIRPGQ